MAYSSKYYNPRKAHEYYMRTRELKGYDDRYGGSRGDGTSAASTPGYLSKSAYEAKKTGKNDSDYKAYNLSIQSKINSLRNDISNKRTMTNDANRGLRDELNNMSKEDRDFNRDSFNEAIYSNKLLLHDEQEQLRDQIQRLKQSQKGGSTSGFNQKGREAAAYIKNQMEQERDNIISKANKDADKEMLGKVKKLSADIKAMRESGRGFSHKELQSRIKSMLGETKKIKIKSKRTKTSEYKQKYKDEIDKLRQDDSMFEYWDKKAEREKQYQANKVSRMMVDSRRRAGL